MACRYTYQGKTYEAVEFDDVLRAMAPSVAAQYMPSVRSVPAAPFVTATDKWLSLALKRIITMAAQEGYDRVAFVNGEQSADRYDLSKQIKQVDAAKMSGDYYMVVATGNDGRSVIEKAIATGALPDVLGKELAEKIVADGGGTYSGLDLKVGGEGMKAFYDKIVPTAANKLLAKLGGGKVEAVDLGGADRAKRRELIRERRDLAADDPRREVLTSEIDRLSAMEAGTASPMDAQPGFTITPAIREKAAQGLPMFSRADLFSFGLPLAEAQAIVKDLTKKWKNGPDIEVVATTADLPFAAPDNANGMYHRGKVWVVASRHRTRADIARKLAHEAVAHYGLRNILGADDWRRFMGNIQLAIKSGNKPLKDIQAKVRRAYVDEQGRFNLTPNQEADEIAAKVVEDAIGPNGEFRPGFGFVKSVYARIVEFLRDLGLDVKLTMAEVQGMLVLAQRNLEAGRRTAGGGDVVVAARNGGQNGPMANRKDVVGNQGGRSADDITPGSFDPADPDIRFSRAEPGRSGWDMPEDGRLDKILYELQDSTIDLKRVQEAIKQAGKDIDERFDARQAETLYSGRVAKRSENFLTNEVRPMLQAMALLKVDINELGDYLIARHAPERNAQIAKINPDIPDGGAGRNSEGTLMTDEAAQEYLDAIPEDKRKKLETLAAKVDAITKGTRDLWVSEGLETPETVAAMQKAYKHYVPLFKDEADFSHPQGMGFSVRGAASKRAMGSTKQVTNVLAHVLMAREAAITRAEKNRVGMSLYGLALSHPNKDFWTVIRPNMSNEAIASELNAMGVDLDMLGEGMSPQPTVRVIDPTTGTVVTKPNQAYKNLPNALMLKVAGEDRVILFNDKNQRAMRLAMSLKNLDGLTKLELAASIVGKATRYLASVNTQYNPVFGLVNVIRDFQSAALNLSTTPIANKSRQVMSDTPAALIGIARDLRGDSARTEWSDLWEQYQEDGGQTGYRELFKTADERAKAVEKELQSMDRSSPGKAAHAVLDLLDDFNTALENAVRLSAYKAALDNGLSRKEAAKIGKELTVNFNRKGRTGRELSPLYAFMNASIQGNARIIETLRGNLGAKIIAGGLMLGAVQALMLAAAGFDDDDIDEWTKSRALIIPVGLDSKRYVAIPMALGLNVIPNTGRVLAEIGLNGGKNAAAKVGSAVGEIVGSLNPMGGGNVFTADGALKLIAPTIFDPAIEVVANRNFAGSSIERERLENDGRPGYQRARESTQRSATGQAYIGISKALNYMSAGTPWEAGAVSPSPEMVRYVATTLGGGLLREVEKVVDAGVNWMIDEDVKAARVPMAGRFYGEVDADRVEAKRYYEAKRKIEKVERSIKAARKAGDDVAADRVEEENKVSELAGQLDRVQSRLRKLNKQATETINNPKEMREIDKERIEAMKDLNDEMKALESLQFGETVGSKLRKVAAQP